MPPIAPADSPFFETVVDPSLFEDDMTEPPVAAAMADVACEEEELVTDEELIELEAMEEELIELEATEDDDDGVADELDDAALDAAAEDWVELPCD